MLYAEVIVKQRTNVEELTYSVPAQIVPYLKMGSLVTVPLRRRSVRGIVVGMKRSVSKELRGKIRPISQIERGDSLSDRQIQVIRRLADYYGASLAEVAFHALSQPAQVDSFTKISPDKPRFLQADWPERISEYAKLIAKNEGKTFLFLFAQVTFARDFANLAKVVGRNVILDDGKAGGRKMIEKCQAGGSPFVLIATLQRAFFPLKCGDFIVVDQPDHIGAKQFLRPFMGLKTIARFRAKIEGLNLVYGSVLPAVEDIPRFSRGEWELIAQRKKRQALTIISRRQAKGLFVLGLLEELKHRIQKKQKILFLVLARGWAPALVCSSCGYIFECSSCGRTTSVDKGRMCCRYCHKVDEIPATCPICRQVELREVGEGVARAASELKTIFPGVSVQEYSSDSPDFEAKAQLTVATEKIFNIPKMKIDSIVVLSADRLLTAADMKNSWELMSYIIQFQSWSKDVIIQTFFPEHPIWGLAGGGKIKEFFVSELHLRRKYHLPPYAVLFSLVGQSYSINTLKDQAEDIIGQVTAVFNRVEIGHVDFEKLPSGDHRARFSVLTPQFSSKQKAIIRDLLPPSWHLDIES